MNFPKGMNKVLIVLDCWSDKTFKDVNLGCGKLQRRFFIL